MTAEGGVPAAEPWDHPQWGRFTFNGYAWVGTVPAPGFDAFVFENGYDPPTPPTGNYELMFSAEDGSDVPSAAAVAVAAAVLTHHEELASRVTAALWDDFNGRGPDSGMWWHDALDEVSEGIEPAPQGPDDLLGRMRLRRIVLWKNAYRYEKPIAVLNFSAEFEEEHGVGMLTDGQTILGAGYSADVSPYH